MRSADFWHPTGIRVGGVSLLRSNGAFFNQVAGILVTGLDNAVEENLTTDSASGILFATDGHFWANNRASDNTTDFDLGATTQTDGGGNVPF